MSQRLGIIGAGKLGTAIGRLALDAGYEVRISGSDRQPMLGLVIDTVLPGARLLPEADVVADSNLVVLAIPFGKADTIDYAALEGKVVIDAMNAWDAAGGHPDPDWDGTTSSSSLRATRACVWSSRSTISATPIWSPTPTRLAIRCAARSPSSPTTRVRANVSPSSSTGSVSTRSRRPAPRRAASNPIHPSSATRWAPPNFGQRCRAR